MPSQNTVHRTIKSIHGCRKTPTSLCYFLLKSTGSPLHYPRLNKPPKNKMSQKEELLASFYDWRYLNDHLNRQTYDAQQQQQGPDIKFRVCEESELGLKLSEPQVQSLGYLANVPERSPETVFQESRKRQDRRQNQARGDSRHFPASERGQKIESSERRNTRKEYQFRNQTPKSFSRLKFILSILFHIQQKVQSKLLPYLYNTPSQHFSLTRVRLLITSRPPLRFLLKPFSLSPTRYILTHILLKHFDLQSQYLDLCI